MTQRAGGLPGERPGPGATRPLRAAAAPAFSLLEILIALTLITLIAGLVIPMSLGAIARAAAAEAQPRLETAVAQARLEASRRGVPVRLVVAAGGGVIRIEAMVIEDRGTPSAFAESSNGLSLDRAGRAAADAPEAARLDEGEQPRPAEWTLIDEVQLPQGLLLERATEDDAGPAAAALSVFTMGDPSAASTAVADPFEAPPESFAFATALPDGRLERLGPGVLVRQTSDQQRRWQVGLAAWTGAVTLTELHADDEQTLDADGAPDDEPPLPPPPPASANDTSAGGAR